MFLKVLIWVCALVAFAQSDEELLASLTASMRISIEWIHENTKYDHNSSIIVGVGTGSLMKQGSDINTQVTLAYAGLVLALAKEALAKHPEAKMFFTAQQFSDGLTPVRTEMTEGKSPKTVYEIYEASENNPAYDKCLADFYKANPKPKSPPGPCVFANAACLDTLTKSKNTAAILRNRFTVISTKVTMCTNFKVIYNKLINEQMVEMGGEINKMLEVANSTNGLDPNLRYAFLRKVVLVAMSGYNSLIPKILDYVWTWLLDDGSCGVKTDSVETRVMLSAQCFAVWALKRETLINAVKKN